MKDRICVTIGQDHIYECGTDTIGRAGEGEVAQLEITFPEALSDFDAYLDFKKPSGEKIRTPKLEVADGVALYVVSPYILSENGEIEVQLVLQKESGEIWKSSIKKYKNQISINAVDEIPEKEDFITEGQKVLDALSQEVAEIADILANDADFSQAVIDACGGQTKINTINGIPLKFFVGLQSEYEELTDAQKENLFAIISDDKTKEQIEALLDDIMNDIALLETSVKSLGSKIAPTPEPLESHTLTDAGYYHISVLYDDDMFDFGTIYWDGVHFTVAQQIKEFLGLMIYDNGELVITNDTDTSIDYSTAVFYVAKVGE